MHTFASPEYPLEQLVSEENIDRWNGIYGDQARDWLTELPTIVSEYAEKWALEIGEQLSGGTVSVVIGARQNDEPVVLKIHPPWIMPISPKKKTSAETESAAFTIWDGDGAPRLLANDEHALLLERIVPAEHSPEMTARDIANLITKIAQPVSIKYGVQLGLPLLDTEVQKRFWRANDRRPEEISYELLLNATNIAAWMCTMTSMWAEAKMESELVHGDFKVKNILKRPDNSYVMIDPSPAIGSRLYDAAVWSIDKPEGITERCEEVSDCLEINPQIIGGIAIALTIPEICLASEARAEATLNYVRNLAGTDDLEHYFFRRFMNDNFMERYTVTYDSSKQQRNFAGARMLQ